MARAMTTLFWLALAVPSVCSAELRAVRVEIGGMDCSACPYVMRVAIAELEGVDTVAVSRNQHALEIRLLPGNGITIEQIHGIDRDRGFRPERTDAQMTGRVVLHQARPAIRLEGPGVTYLVEDDPRAMGLAEKFEREALGKRVVAAGAVHEITHGKPGALDLDNRRKLLLRAFAVIPGD